MNWLQLKEIRLHFWNQQLYMYIINVNEPDSVTGKYASLHTVVDLGRTAAAAVRRCQLQLRPSDGDADGSSVWDTVLTFFHALSSRLSY
jgi:hypothetical protein